MAKRPAFLFYSNDFFEGTRTMLPEERACYVDLMVYQHQHDYIPNDIRRIAMYCTGISEATLKATLEAKFKLCENGWYNERLQEVMNDYEEYSNSQSKNGTYGQFIKKLNQDKSIKNLTELKEFIENVYTKKQLIEDLNINNDYKTNLEALLKRCLSMRVESESESNLTNSSNNTNSEISKKIALPLKYSELSSELKTNSKTKEVCVKTYFIKPLKYDSFVYCFLGTYSDHSENEIIDF